MLGAARQLIITSLLLSTAIFPLYKPDTAALIHTGSPPAQDNLITDEPLGDIVFVSDSTGSREIYTINADGSGLRQLTSTGTYETEPDVSPNRMVILYTFFDQGNLRIGAMLNSGLGNSVMTGGASREGLARWSPDGSRIAYHSNRDGDSDIYLINSRDGGGLVQITNDPGADEWPVWTPDGQRIVFQSNRSGAYDLYSMDTNGGDVQRLTNSGNSMTPHVSPDGRSVVFQDYVNNNWDIYVIDLVSREITRLTTSSAGDWVPRWSPDGTQIVFVSNRDGNNNIFVMDAHGGNVRQLTQHPGADEWPTWVPREGGAPSVVQSPPSVESSADVIFADDFSNTTSGWYDGESSDSNGYTTLHYQQGAYRLELGHYYKDQSVSWWVMDRIPALNNVSNFMVEVDARVISSVGMPGIAFRSGPDRFYWFRIDPSQQKYTLVLDYRNGEYAVLVPDTQSSAINAGSQVNRLGVTANGSDIALFVNGQLLTRITDSSYTSGTIGFWLTIPSAGNASSQVSVFEYDNLMVTEPQPLPTAQSAPPAAPPSTGAGCRADAGRALNVRSGPGENYTVIGTLNPGSPLEVTGYNDRWYAVSLYGREGWIAGWVASVSGSCGNLPYRNPSGGVVAPVSQPTPIPTPVPAPQQPEQPAQPNTPESISFTVNSGAEASIAAGQCATVRWDVEGIQTVMYQGAGVAGHDQRQECPAQSTTYELRVTHLDGHQSTHTVRINVTSATPNIRVWVDGSLVVDGQNGFSEHVRCYVQGVSLRWEATGANAVLYGVYAQPATGQRHLYEGMTLPATGDSYEVRPPYDDLRYTEYEIQGINQPDNLHFVSSARIRVIWTPCN